MRKFHMKTRKNLVGRTSANRRGVTMMEVLMSVMIMGLGVIPLATLFPISVSRSVQATQLTNATILRYNAEALLDAFPGRLLHDPDDNASRDEHRYTTRKYVVDPIGYFLAENVYQGRFGNDGQGGAFGVRRHAAGFTVEPLSMPAPSPRVDRPDLAVKFFSQQDSWKLQFEGIPTSNTLNSVTFDPTSPLNDLPTEILQNIKDNIDSRARQEFLTRIVIFDAEGKQAQVRTLFSSSIPTVIDGLIEGFADLPDNSHYVNSGGTGIISKVRFEIQEQRYTFLISVRHQPTRVAAVDVAVFFKRDYSPEREVIHSVTNFVAYLPGADGSPGVDGVDDNQDGNTDDRAELGWKGSDDVINYEFTLHYNDKIKNTPLSLQEEDVKPPLKKGGYIFDAKNCRWYRIQKVTEVDSRTATVALDQPIAQDIRTSGGSAAMANGVMVRPDVVQVYALGNKLDPSN